MDFKLEFIKGIVYIIIGFFLAERFSPNKPQPPLSPEIAASQNCKASIKKVTNPDGSKSEEIDFSANNSLDVKPAPPAATKLGVGVSLFTDKSFQLRYELSNNLSIIGRLQEVNKLDSRKDIGIEFNF